METKYSTGDKVLIPGTIRSAKVVNGKVTYEVDTDSWDVPEEQIRTEKPVPAAKSLLEQLSQGAKAVVRW